MTKLYKLTNQDFTTRDGCLWGEGVTVETSGAGDGCGPGWTHWYLSPELAVLLNPIHADIKDPVLWEGEGEIGARDYQLKVGTTRGTTLRRIPLPECSTEQRVEFAIRCALAVNKEPKFVKWAGAWLSGADRTTAAAGAPRWPERRPI